MKQSIVEFVNSYNRRAITSLVDTNALAGVTMPDNWTAILLENNFLLVTLSATSSLSYSKDARKWCSETFGDMHFLRIGSRKFFFDEPKNATMFALKWL